MTEKGKVEFCAGLNGIRVFLNDAIPQGEVHFRDRQGNLVGKIINIGQIECGGAGPEGVRG